MKADINSCKVTGPVALRPPDDEPTAQCAGGSQAPSLKSTEQVEPPDCFRFKECQDLFRKRLRDPLLRMIPQLTSLRLHVLWHDPMDLQGSGAIPALCPMAHSRAAAKVRQPKCCASCLQHRWKTTLNMADQGRRFIGQCGITNFYACLQMDNTHPLSLVLQARVASRSPTPYRVSQMKNDQFWTKHAGKPVSPAKFHDAVALTRLILHDLKSTAQARMAGSALDTALRRLKKTDADAARPRGEPCHGLPDLPESAFKPDLGSHVRKLIEAMRDFVHQHYHRPIGLGELALAMQMNASYLSALFSKTTGLTFHQFLEEVRLFKARELLSDPRSRIGDVACATGYASPDSFRRAFKAHEGLSPDTWRARR